MRCQNKCCTYYHPHCRLTHLIHKRTEEGSEEDGKERNHGQKHGRYVQVHAEKRQEDRNAELLESDHATVECHAEDGDHQEARIAQYLPDIRDPELVFLGSLHLVGSACLLVKSCVHCYEYGPENGSDSKNRKADQCRLVSFSEGVELSESLLLYDHRSDQDRCCSSESRDGQLQSHGQGHVPSLEPFCDGAGYRYSGNLASESEEHAADVGDSKRCLRLESCRDCEGHQTCAADHEAHEDGAHKSYAELIQQRSAYDEASPYAKERISAGVESVVRHVPSQFQIFRVLEQL